MRLLGKIVAFILCVFAVLGCTRSELSPVEYVKWVEDESNGLKKTKAMDELEFQVQLKPYNYILMKEANINPLEKKNDFEKEKKQLGEMQYYTLKIKTPDGTDPLKYKLADKEEYYARVKYYSFDIQNDISLVDGKDTLQCALAHFERNFGIAPEIVCLLGFPPSQKSGTNIVEEKSFVYYDRVFNMGNLIFSFSKQDILQLPKLKT